MNNYKVTCFTSSSVKSLHNFNSSSNSSTSSLLILFSRKALRKVLIVRPTYSRLIWSVDGLMKKLTNVNIFDIESLNRSGFDMKHNRIKYMYPTFPVSILRLTIDKVFVRNESMDERI